MARRRSHREEEKIERKKKESDELMKEEQSGETNSCREKRIGANIYVSPELDEKATRLILKGYDRLRERDALAERQEV